MQAPSDLIVVGYVMGAYGIHGWVRVKSYSAEAEALLSVSAWWMEKQGSLCDVKVIKARHHGDEIIAQLSGVTDREYAESLRGSVIQVSRSLFPEPSENEFYWIDLIGLQVVNLRGESLGTIRNLMDNGAHEILVVTIDAQNETEKRKELLIPFVDQFVINVDLKQRKVTVDWELDY